MRAFRLLKSEIVAEGKNRSLISKRLDGAFYARGWIEKRFATAIIVDEHRLESPTHAVDCFKEGVALEVEWNNKDPFFDRDLNNFRLLFELRAIQVGVIVTRGSELQKIFKILDKGHPMAIRQHILISYCPVLMVAAVSDARFLSLPYPIDCTSMISQLSNAFPWQS